MNSGAKYYNGRNRHLHCVPAWFFFLLTVFIGNNFLHAQTEPHVLLVTESKATRADGEVFRRDLVKISKNGKEKIAELTDFLIFGKDESSVAILDGHYRDQSDEWRKNDWDLWVIDRATSKLVAHTVLHDFPALPWIRDCVEQLAVRSQDSMVYVPIRCDNREKHYSEYGMAYVNWNGGVRLDQKPHKEMLNMMDLFPVPPGYGMYFDYPAKPNRKPAVALYDAEAQKSRLVAIQGNEYDNDQFVFVPTVGLVQNHQGALYRLSDASLKTDIPEPERIPISNVDGRMFACLVQGKPCLLWGERKAESGTISEIVLYDWNSKRVALRISLAEPTSSLQMDQSGSRLYFLYGGQEKIYFLDIEKREIGMFSDLGLIVQSKSYTFTYSGKSLRTILDAY